MKLIIGSIYRPTNNNVTYANLLSDTIEEIYRKSKKSVIWLCGHFNLPDIVWDNQTVSGHEYRQTINKRFIDMEALCGPEKTISWV